MLKIKIIYNLIDTIRKFVIRISKYVFKLVKFNNQKQFLLHRSSQKYAF